MSVLPLNGSQLFQVGTQELLHPGLIRKLGFGREFGQEGVGRRESRQDETASR